MNSGVKISLSKSEQYKKWVSSNREKRREIDARYRERNREKRTAQWKAWYLENKDKFNAYSSEWKRKNPEKANASYLRYRLSNKADIRARRCARRAKKLNATPAWANAFFMVEAYRLAALRTKMLGYKWSVDHIVPLISNKVCGLHSHTNLRVIPERENQRKSNRYWPDMP